MYRNSLLQEKFIAAPTQNLTCVKQKSGYCIASLSYVQSQSRNNYVNIKKEPCQNYLIYLEKNLKTIAKR